MKYTLLLLMSLLAGMSVMLQQRSYAQAQIEVTDPAPTTGATTPVESQPVPQPLLPAEISASTTPADFLDTVSHQAKARWRSLYRPPAAAAPPTERLRVAFTLGGLIADSHLAYQAGDAQHFKNINQDLLRYCGSLAIGEKITPMLMSESKMAEGQEWEAVRPMLNEKGVLIEKLLRDQRDEDPAMLVNLGMWFRLIEISTDAVVADPESKDRMVCIGSVSLLKTLIQRYEMLSDGVKNDTSIVLIGKVLGQLQRRWPMVEDQPSNELVEFTSEKIKAANDKITLKAAVDRSSSENRP